MLFHTFDTQEERKNYGGSAFIELQYCDLPRHSSIKELVAVENIQNWKNDSLYIHMDNDNTFYQEYSRIFDCGIYNNLKNGPVDVYGINYYAPSLIKVLLERLDKERPTDYKELITWLMKATSCNGFYILGY